MIFADKLIQLRKKSGWSQEELAEQMKVTRQSVSKWEGAQSIPDLDKMLALSKLFGVSTDYLLKDEIEETGEACFTEDTPVRRVSMEEASAFLEVKKITARHIAYATFLCVLSPVCLLVLGGLSEIPGSGLPEAVAAGVGLAVLFALATVAVAIFISSGSKTAPYLYLEKETFETEYGVSGMVKERKEQYKATHTKCNTAGACLCIGSLIPLFIGLAYDENNLLLLVCMLAIFFTIVGLGVVLFIRSGIIWASFEKLLQEGEYSKQGKKIASLLSPVSLVYWLGFTAVYLAYSLPNDNWDESWIIWVVAGVLYPAVVAICSAIVQRRKP